MRVVRRHHPTFPCGDVLDWVKAKNRHMRDTAYPPPLVAGSQGVTGILDHDPSPAFSQLHKLVQSSRMTSEIDR